MDRLKILVVDDESRMRKLVRDFLVKHDFDVVETVRQHWIYFMMTKTLH